MFRLFLLLMAVLTTAFWLLFSWQNLSTIFGFEALSQFLLPEQMFLAISAGSPVLAVWLFVAWLMARRSAGKSTGRMVLREQEEAEEFYPQGPGRQEQAGSPEALGLAGRAELRDGAEEDGSSVDRASNPAERERQAPPRADLPPSAGASAPPEARARAAEEKNAAGLALAGAPPSVLRGGLKLDDLIQEKQEQDRREANKWEIDSNHPFADAVLVDRPEGTKTPDNVRAGQEPVRRRPEQPAQPDDAPAPRQTAAPEAAAADQAAAAAAVNARRDAALDARRDIGMDAGRDAGATPRVGLYGESQADQSRRFSAPQKRQPPQPQAVTPNNGTANNLAPQVKLPPHPGDHGLAKPQALSLEQLGQLEQRVRGQLNSIAMDLASIISAPERYDSAFRSFNQGAGGQEAFFKLIAEDLYSSRGDQMGQQLRLLGGKAILKSYVSKFQHLLATSQLSDKSGQTTHRLSQSGMGEVCRVLMESQSPHFED